MCTQSQLEDNNSVSPRISEVCIALCIHLPGRCPYLGQYDYNYIVTLQMAALFPRNMITVRRR